MNSYQFFNKITKQFLFRIEFNNQLNINSSVLNKLIKYTGIIFNIDIEYKKEENYS